MRPSRRWTEERALRPAAACTIVPWARQGEVWELSPGATQTLGRGWHGWDQTMCTRVRVAGY